MENRLVLGARVLAVVGPWVGLALLAWLAWAVGARLDYWPARSFVLLLYGAALSSLLASSATVWLRRRSGWTAHWSCTWARRLLGAVVLLVACWLFCPGSKVVVGHLLRRLSVLQLR